MTDVLLALDKPPASFYTRAMSENLEPPNGITPTAWQHTPPAVRTLVRALQQQVAAFQIQVQTFQAQVTELEVRLHQHSGNSSRPPSSDPPSAPKRPARPPRGRRRGGQPGHPGHFRPPVPPEQVDQVIVHPPAACPHCQAELPPDLPPVGAPRTQQVWELPPVRPLVTEHRFPTVTCPHCPHLVSAPAPPDVPPGAFGPYLTALVGLLQGRYRLSARECAALLGEVLGVPLGLGSVPALCQQVSGALTAPYQEAAALLPAQPVANVDETGWKQAGQRRWLWGAVTATVTLFRVAPQRNTAALQALLGPGFRGVIGSDRYKAYAPWPLEKRQLCWAHLLRDVRAFADRAGPGGEWGTTGLGHIQELFAAWPAFRAGLTDRAGLQAALAPVQAAVRAWLRAGLGLALPAAAQFSRALLTRDAALWTFAYVEGVEPTNNAAERALRPAVLWRKGCFGAVSDAGNEFVARVLTVIATCRQQGRHLWTFLGDAVQAYWAKRSAPRLVPTL
jgi:transposase